MLIDKYKVTFTLTRDMLATNSCDPNVHDVHILQRQRKLILEKSALNAQINKYLDAIQISKERGDEETDALLAKIEALAGFPLSDEDRAKVLAGELEELRETLGDIDTTGTTVFFWDKEKNLPCIGDHMILGALKGAAEAISRTLPAKKGVPLHSASYTASLINQHVRVKERFITFDKDIKRLPNGDPEYLQRSLRAKTAQGPRISLAKSEVVPAGATLNFHLKVLGNSPITESIIRNLFDYGEIGGLGQWRNVGNGEYSYEMTKL